MAGLGFKFRVRAAQLTDDALCERARVNETKERSSEVWYIVTNTAEFRIGKLDQVIAYVGLPTCSACCSGTLVPFILL